jgi:hypothetical protein
MRVCAVLCVCVRVGREKEVGREGGREGEGKGGRERTGERSRGR